VLTVNNRRELEGLTGGAVRRLVVFERNVLFTKRMLENLLFVASVAAGLPILCCNKIRL